MPHVPQPDANRDATRRRQMDAMLTRLAAAMGTQVVAILWDDGVPLVVEVKDAVAPAVSR